MKNKRFLSKIEELKSETPSPLDVEHKLLPRLKFMGYLMYVLCLITFIYALTVTEETDIIGPPTPEGFIEPDQTESVSDFEIFAEDDELELSPTDVFNFHLVALIFAVVGTTCFLIVWKKKKTLFHSHHPRKK